MLAARRLRSIVVSGLVLTVGCTQDGDVTPKTDQILSNNVELQAPSNLPLREIMRGLEADLAAVAHGIWIADHEAVRTAANRIAEHPKVIPEQVAAIQAALGGEFPAFVQQDLAVHGAAMDLIEAVDASRTTSELFDIFLRAQQGCMSCHSCYRTRVAEALTDTGSATETP